METSSHGPSETVHREYQEREKQEIARLAGPLNAFLSSHITTHSFAATYSPDSDVRFFGANPEALHAYATGKAVFTRIDMVQGEEADVITQIHGTSRGSGEGTGQLVDVYLVRDALRQFLEANPDLKPADGSDDAV